MLTSEPLGEKDFNAKGAEDFAKVAEEKLLCVPLRKPLRAFALNHNFAS